MISHYAVNETFDSIQGEGPFAGVPMSFIRLQGCSVACPFCDTKDSWKRKPGTTSLAELAASKNLAHVCITGGEPAQSPHLDELLAAFLRQGKQVHLETSGAGKATPSMRFCTVVLSPKLHALDKIDPDITAVASAIKFVLGDPADLAKIDEWLAASRVTAPIYLQPVWDSGMSSFCVETCKARGWRFSAQLHKYLGLR